MSCTHLSEYFSRSWLLSVMLYTSSAEDKPQAITSKTINLDKSIFYQYLILSVYYTLASLYI